MITLKITEKAWKDLARLYINRPEGVRVYLKFPEVGITLKIQGFELLPRDPKKPEEGKG
jgi:hypothetical protein